MQIEIEGRPSYAMAVVQLDPGDRVVAEAGAMVAMSPGLGVETGFMGAGTGGLLDWLKAALAGLARKLLAGESMFVNTFKATRDTGKVMLAPSMVGDVAHVELDGARTITVQAESYLASSPTVSVSLVWGGLSMLFGGESAWFLACRGKGDLLLNSYGAIEKIEIDGAYVVDTGHVVAWEGDLKHTLKKAGGWKSAMFSGEGMVLEFKGKGTVWLQTRNLSSLIDWISPFFPG